MNQNGVQMKNKSVVGCIVFALVLFALPALCCAQMDNYFKEYLDGLKATNTPLFYSACQQDGIKSFLLFPLNQGEPLLVEIKDQAVMNLAKITITNGRPALQETHGGVYSYNRIAGLLTRMETFEYRLVDADGLLKVIKMPVKRRCR